MEISITKVTDPDLSEQDCITLVLPWDGEFERVAYYRSVLLNHTDLCNNSLFAFFSLALFHFPYGRNSKMSGMYYIDNAISSIK